jgi:hypothetical protein
MYGGGHTFESKINNFVDPAGGAIDKQVAKQNPQLAAEYGVPGSPGRAQAVRQLQEKSAQQAADKAAFEARLRAMYPAAYQQAALTGQIAASPLGNAFIESQSQQTPKTIM